MVCNSAKVGVYINARSAACFLYIVHPGAIQKVKWGYLTSSWMKSILDAWETYISNHWHVIRPGYCSVVQLSWFMWGLSEVDRGWHGHYDTVPDTTNCCFVCSLTPFYQNQQEHLKQGWATAACLLYWSAHVPQASMTLGCLWSCPWFTFDWTTS